MRIQEIKRIYSDFSSYYDREVKRELHYTAYLRLPELVIGHLDSAAPEILDLGCGTGLSSLLFFKSGCRVTGVDATRAMLERAGRLPFRKLICQDLGKDLKVKDLSFDAAVMIGVMEYIDDPAALLARVRRKLRRGGVFGLTVPQRSSLYSEAGLKSYYRKEVEPAMAEAGYTIIGRERIVGIQEGVRRTYFWNYVLKC
ncbi:MAG TPA: class I SAM-dependent methyltransferase [Pyrinomonadaceae bacterium]|jgi:SAM-dependent methyltransferase